MQAIVFADRDGAELSPLNSVICPAMLPVNGKPVIEHCLEDLVLNGIEELFLVTGNNNAPMRKFLADGSRWSLRIHYVLSKSDECPDRVRSRLGSKLRAPFMAVRGDILRSSHRWIASLPSKAASLSWLDSNNSPLGLIQVLQDTASLAELAWPLTQPQPTQHRQSMHDSHACLFSSLAQYHHAALARLQQPNSMGQPRGVSIRAGKQCDIHHRSQTQGITVLGDYSRIHPEARLNGNVAIGKHCLIDRGARISNSVILNGTYIGAGLAVENAIVYGDRMIRVDMDAQLYLSERFLLADNTLHNNSLPGLINPLAASALLLCSLPLWPVAATLAYARNPNQVLLSKPLLSNRISRSAQGPQPQSFTAWRWNTPSPLLSGLPLLLAALQGHLRLFGRDHGFPQPIKPGAAAEQVNTPGPWQAQYESLPRGVLSPARLVLGANCPRETVELMEIELYAKRTVFQRLRGCYQAASTLLKRNSWRHTEPLH